MRRLNIVLLLGSLIVVDAGWSSAAPLNWEGTLALEFQDVPPMAIAGGGVATVNQSSGGVPAHLQTLKIKASRGGISGTAMQPTTEGTTAQRFFPAQSSIRIDAELGTGTLAPISGGVQSTTVLSQNVIPLRGVMKFCWFSTACGSFMPVALTESTAMGGSKGFGIGGLLTIGGGTSPLRISLEAAPWTIKTAVLTDEIRTPMGEDKFINVTAMGFAHGPASGTTSTAQPAGVLQLVAPMQIATNQTYGTTKQIALFGVLQVRFIPEPGMLVLLVSGGLGLALLGRGRFRE